MDKKNDTDYFKGDKIQFTGKTELLYGGLFDEFIYLDGYKKGKKGYKKAKPKGEIR